MSQIIGRDVKSLQGSFTGSYRKSCIKNPHPDNLELIESPTPVPLDMATVPASVRKTGRALVLYGGTELLGAAAPYAAQIKEQAFTDLNAPVMRAGPAESLIPLAGASEGKLRGKAWPEKRGSSGCCCIGKGCISRLRVVMASVSRF